MSRLVIDASVAAKWLFPEVHGEEALRVLRDTEAALVPDLVFAELGSILWKRVRSGELTDDEAGRLALGLSRLPFEPHACRDLLPAALEIACQTGASVYDSLYVALALREKVSCVTADRRLYDRMAATGLSGSVLWIGEF